ncbi:MAG: antitoxin VapB family protein [Candidatus Heimdallarchaeaceae archaeon]
MATKTISIKEEVYNKLVAMKRKEESFSDLLNRLAESQKSDNILREIRGSIELDSAEEVIKEIREKREGWHE